MLQWIVRCITNLFEVYVTKKVLVKYENKKEGNCAVVMKESDARWGKVIKEHDIGLYLITMYVR